jgi:hypothetical protein
MFTHRRKPTHYPWLSASTIAGTVSSSEIQATAKPNAISNAENPQRQKSVDTTKEANKAETQELVMRLFSPEIAREMAGAIAWVAYITGGLEISVWLIVEIVLEDADNLIKAYLRGHASSRTTEEMCRKETAKILSSILVRVNTKTSASFTSQLIPKFLFFGHRP